MKQIYFFQRAILERGINFLFYTLFSSQMWSENFFGRVHPSFSLLFFILLDFTECSKQVKTFSLSCFHFLICFPSSFQPFQTKPKRTKNHNFDHACFNWLIICLNIFFKMQQFIISINSYSLLCDN